MQNLRRMLDEGPKGFEGDISADTYRSITGASKATATRDLKDSVDKGVFTLPGGGRSTHTISLVAGLALREMRCAVACYQSFHQSWECTRQDLISACSSLDYRNMVGCVHGVGDQIYEAGR